MGSLIVIGNAALSVAVATSGAELRSLKTASGQQLLWQGDEENWGGEMNRGTRGRIPGRQRGDEEA